MTEATSNLTAVEFIVPRISHKETTFAIVRARVANDKLRDESAFLEALQRACSNWVQDFEIGREAWEQACCDMNVGDLGGELGDNDLTGCLGAQGIVDLEIACYAHVGQSGEWAYDTVLADEPEEDE